jgi:hypothetical protein
MLFALIPLRAALGAAPLQLMGMGPSNYAPACNAAPWELERSPHNAHNIKYIVLRVRKGQWRLRHACATFLP